MGARQPIERRGFEDARHRNRQTDTEMVDLNERPICAHCVEAIKTGV